MITVGGWVLFAFIALCIGGVATWIFIDLCNTGASIALTILISIVLVVVTFFCIRWYFNGTEAGKRAVKDQESNFKGGISRVVEVYDMEGDLLKTYSGEFDVEMHDTYVLFDDENGDRHIVYFTTGTVVIDEIGAANH